MPFPRRKPACRRIEGFPNMGFDRRVGSADERGSLDDEHQKPKRKVNIRRNTEVKQKIDRSA
jgi:hypothetical protein